MLELEYRFININKEDIREKLKFRGGELMYNEFKMNRVIFHERQNPSINGMIRIRREFDKITLAYKSRENDAGFKEEIETTVEDFDKTVNIFLNAGLTISSRQESLREKWLFDETEITIDTRPFLEPYVEIEASSEEKILEVAKDLGLDLSDRVTGGVVALYEKKYNLTEEEVEKRLENITFDKNPFV